MVHSLVGFAKTFPEDEEVSLRMVGGGRMGLEDDATLEEVDARRTARGGGGGGMEGDLATSAMFYTARYRLALCLLSGDGNTLRWMCGSMVGAAVVHYSRVGEVRPVSWSTAADTWKICALGDADVAGA